jgi:hypothetical protein
MRFCILLDFGAADAKIDVSKVKKDFIEATNPMVVP